MAENTVKMGLKKVFLVKTIPEYCSTWVIAENEVRMGLNKVC